MDLFLKALGGTLRGRYVLQLQLSLCLHSYLPKFLITQFLICKGKILNWYKLQTDAVIPTELS